MGFTEVISPRNKWTPVHFVDPRGYCDVTLGKTSKKMRQMEVWIREKTDRFCLSMVWLYSFCGSVSWSLLSCYQGLNMFSLMFSGYGTKPCLSWLIFLTTNYLSNWPNGNKKGGTNLCELFWTVNFFCRIKPLQQKVLSIWIDCVLPLTFRKFSRRTITVVGSPEWQPNIFPGKRPRKTFQNFFWVFQKGEDERYDLLIFWSILLSLFFSHQTQYKTKHLNIF